MKYDSNGNLVSVTTTGLNTDVNTYENGNLIRTVTGGNGTYEYTYDATYTHRLTSVTNDLITQSMSYDGMGNLTSTILSGTGNKTISTSAGYDSTGNRLTSVVDATGAEVTYSYGTASSQMLGLPTAIENPNGTVTTTEYDLYNRVSETAVASWASLVYNYSNGNLGAITRTNNANAGQTYSFAYDDFGNTLSISVGERTLAAYEYAPGNGQLARQTYGNGDVVSFTYDNLGRTKTITHDDGSVLTYTYNGEGQLYSATEINGEETTTYLYTYDSLGRLVYSEKKDSTTSHLRTHQEYNSNNQLTENSWQLGEAAYSESYTYSADDGSLSSITITEGENSSTVSMTYDELCRLSQKTIARNGVTLVTYTYTYRDMSDTATTTQVASLTVASPDSNVTYCYSYDISGNITQISDGTTTTTYDYDALGQLRSVSDGTNTYSYTYDAVGNLLAANGHSYSYEDTLGWGDLLTAYDGQTITHDAIGNPLNDGTWTYTWENGRELASMTDGTTTWTYTYDADGMRASRSNGSTTYEYVYNGDSLLKMTVDNNTLYFTSDTVTYNGVTYYYVTNLQGDVIAILDSSGAFVVEYTYDAWGNILTTTGSMAATLGAHNPLRYRGYVYDAETTLYYLQSRYYDSQLGRFLNADAFASTGQGILGNNMFAYCLNNPIIHADSEGNLPGGIINPNAMTCDGGSSLHPIPDKERQGVSTSHDDRSGTLFAGYSFAATYGAGGSVAIGVGVDRYWNMGLIVTLAAGGGFPSTGMVKVWGITNAPTIYDLSGWSGQVGGSINAYGGSVGIERSYFSNPQNGESYQGLAFMLGAKAASPVELHGTAGYSFVYGGNLFDILIYLSRAISFY